MNKLKVLYDLVRTMKNKEAFNGTLTAQVHKDDVEVFSFRNEFSKNLITGQTKAKINSALNCDGNTVKHESTNEFTFPHNGNCRSHEFFKRLHRPHGDGCCTGLKGHLGRLAFAFSLLNALQVEEQSDKTVVISLSDTDLPEDTKAIIRERMNQACSCHHHGFMKEFGAVTDPEFVVRIFVNKNFEIDKIIATFVGVRQDVAAAACDFTARAELSFVW